ncbi:hypothetical protein QL285_051715 [Trifolium repens]|nr:hypothetical protein QL285_051715 [Trifolium repens]
MSQPSQQTSSPNTSPNKSSPSKTTTTTPNVTENPSVTLPQPSDVITDATPLTMIHPSFASILKPTPLNSSPSPKSKPKKKTKSATTRKPKSQKSKSRYSSNFDMQKLYLDDSGNASTNVASDVATPCADAKIETNKEDSTQTLISKKGETAEMAEQNVPNTPVDEGVDEETQNIKIAEDVLKSLVDSVSSDKAVPDAPASLAQDKPQDEMANDVVDDSPVQQEKDVTANVNTDNAMSVEDNIDYVTADEAVEEEDANEDGNTEDDVTIMKIVGDSKKRGGKTSVGNRLRTRKAKVTEVVAEEPKSTKKKNVAAEATKSPKKKKVAAEATTSTKKKMYGPVRRSSRVEIPAKQKKKASKRKTIELSDSEADAEEDAPTLPTSSKQKTPKKRKIVADASIDDAEENAPSIVLAKKKAGRTIPQNVPDVPMDNVSFHFSASAAKWKFVYHRRLTLERELSDEALECKDVMDLIQQAGLMKTVSGLGKCYEKLVKEFIVNIGEDCDNRLSKEFHQVFVRGKCVDFSPAVINRFLGRREDGYSELEPTNNLVCKTITANQVKVWPLKGKVPSAMLSVKYAILNRIGAINWVPTTHSSTIATSLAKFIYAIGTGTEANFGSLIFDQIVDHGKSWAVQLVIAFPSLICGIILDQHPNILLPEDVPCKRESPMAFSYKLFEGKHAADIIVPSKKVIPAGKVASSSMNRKSMIMSMEAAVKALDEQKIELEKVISALKQEEAEEEGLAAANAGVNEAGNGVDVADGDAVMNVDDEAGGDTEELEVSESSTSF